jgi:methylmalonyl-CoA mutase cobalamin-binding domain/chain
LIDAADTARAVSEQVIQPHIAEQREGVSIVRGKIVLGTVLGDLHDIGKNMVSLMLQVNGFDVLDLGVNVAPRAFFDKAREVGADIVGLSSLMTTSMPYMREVIALRDGLGSRDDFSVIVGGAPVTADYSQAIGADSFGRDAMEAVTECLALMDRRSQAS